MGARKKLNAHFVAGGLLMAGIIGALAESWLVFLVMAAVLIGSSLYVGEIRLPKNER